MTPDENLTKAIEKYLRQWQKVSGRIEKIIEPYAKDQAKIQKAVQAITEASSEIYKQVEPHQLAWEEWRKAKEAFQQYQFANSSLDSFLEQARTLQSSFQESISPVFEDVQKSLDDLPEKTREALMILGMHGWYFDIRMPISALWRIVKALEDGNMQGVDELLSKYFEEKLDSIEDSISDIFPSRKKVLGSAFSAHRRGDYDLSIPVFLAHTDGICKEVINEYFFIKANRRPRAAIYVESIAISAYQEAF